ncbi:MAG TPA: hypothetical protein VFW90_03170 [Candidatus Saccharimonadales bacterium]|nr:hypothetical protein [Candidatus Saccharimonadales bacterium]
MAQLQSRSSRVKAVILLVLVVTAGLILIGAEINRNGAQAAPSKKGHGKQLRAILQRSSRHVCGTPKRGFARCLAQITTDNIGQPLAGSPDSTDSLGPVQFHTAYNLPCKPGGQVASICSTPETFGPEIIAIVDAGNFSTGSSGLESSLQNYDQFYGLPACTMANGCLSVVNQSGTTSPLPADAGWSDEIALDVETAHMICQTCQIVLIEANSTSTVDLATANDTAASYNPASISNSWGSDTDVSALDSSFNHPGIAIVASTGDSGTVSNGPAWPADNPNVIAAAGTTLQMFSDNTWAGETVWSGSGGGCSTFYSAPTWQTSLPEWGTNGCGSFRAFGDVSADADPNTGAAVNINSTWFRIGGTSLSAPIIASIFALTGGLPGGTNGPTVPYSSFNTANSHDVTSGNDCTSTHTTHCTAASGFDTPSGLGSPNGVSGLASLPSQPVLTAKDVNQNQIDLSWTASSSSSGIKNYQLYRNGSQIAAQTGTSYSDTSLSANTSYNYYVIANDNNGNASLASQSVSGFTAFMADINEDAHIGLTDLNLLVSKFGQSGSNLGRSDIDSNQTVNVFDLSLLESKYGSE